MSASPSPVAERAPAAASGYTRGARKLGILIGITGVVTYAYFALASHALGPTRYGRISLLWSAIFIVASVLYRPVEQLLSRTIADRDTRGVKGNEHLRVAATIQLGFGVLFTVLALVFRHPLQHGLFGGSSTLYLILIVAVLAYTASYFARGYLAGHRWFGLYGGLVLMESVSRCMFSLLAVIGVATSQRFVAAGMAAAPIVSLTVVPFALGRRIRTDSQEGDVRRAEAADVAALEEPAGEAEFTLAHGTGFAVAVVLIMVSEQTFLNAGPLLVKATAPENGAALAGFAFNVLLIARAPLQLFQAIQTAILPHLTNLSTRGEADPFRRSIQATVRAIAAFAAVVGLGALALGPFAMHAIFGGSHHYGRFGLVLVAVGMGIYLSAATLNQAALARGRARQAAACWLAAAVAFAVFLVLPIGGDRVLRVEIGYLGGASLLCALLYGLYRRSL